MKQVGMNPQVTSLGAVKHTTGTGPVKKAVAPTEAKPQTQVSAPTTKAVAGFDERGIQTLSNADGSVSQKSQSGVQLNTAADGVKTLTLPGGEGSFKLEGDQVEVTSGEAKGASIFTNPEGLQLVAYNDKAGNHIQVHPDSMTFEVMNPGQTVSQVFHPNGYQEVVALGNEKLPDGKTQSYEKRALFDQSGEMVQQQGFSGFDVKGNKLSFDLGSGKATRTLPRPLPGQTVETPAKTETSAASVNSAPTSLLAEQPMLLTGPEQPLLLEGPKNNSQTAQATSADPAKEAADAAKAERKERLESLKSVGADYFTPKELPEGSVIGDTPSGVVRRMDKDAIGFSLPTGDQFRTDGELVAVLGDNPRAKNARLVEEDGRTVIAYRDAQRNNYQLDVNTGDLEVSNPDGSLKQKLFADGRESITATSVHTSEAGKVSTSTHGLLLDPDGSIHQQSGFDNLKIGSKHLEYTLPNGKTTVRNLLMETKGKVKEPEPQSAPGISEGWGDTDSVANSVLGKPDPAVPATNAATGAEQPKELQKSGPTLSGISREELPDGTTKTTLPSGISFVDGGETPYATDADGTRLEVLKQEVPSDGGYILYTKGKSGIGYTIAPEHLDFICEGKEGKVHQLVKANGEILTSITDNGNQHVHQFDTKKMGYQGSPGVVADPRTPDKLYVMDSPQNRVYTLPHPYPLPENMPGNPGQGMPPGQQPSWPQFPGDQGIPGVPPNNMGQPGMPPNMGQPGMPPNMGQPGMPGMSQPGVQPSFWDKVKNWFGFGHQQQAQQTMGPQGVYQGQGQYPPGPPPYMGGMPGCQYQYDPIAQQTRQIDRFNKVMMGMNVATMGLTMLSTMAMPCMFFPFGGMYF